MSELVENVMKKFIAVFTVCFLAVFISSCALAKVTDPKNPAFDITQFRFEDYSNHKEFLGAIYNVLPVGMGEEEVRKILVDYAGAKEKVYLVKGKEKHLFTKKREPAGFYDCNYGVLVEFDGKNNLKNFDTNFGCTGP